MRRAATIAVVAVLLVACPLKRKSTDGGTSAVDSGPAPVTYSRDLRVGEVVFVTSNTHLYRSPSESRDAIDRTAEGWKRKNDYKAHGGGAIAPLNVNERVTVLGFDGRDVQVRTAGGVEGWTDKIAFGALTP